MKFAYLLALLVDYASAGLLTSASVTPASNVAGATGNVVVAFTAATAIAANGKIKVTFPTGFDLTSSSLGGTVGTNVDGSLTATQATLVVTLLRAGGGVTTGGNALVVTITNVKNPTTAGTTGTYTIATFANDGTTPADTALTGVAGTDIYTAITTASITPASLVKSSVGQVTVAFTTVGAIPNNGKVLVTFPADFGIGGTPAVTVVSNTGVTGTLAPAVSSQTLTLTQSGGAITSAATAVTIVLGNVINPTTATTSVTDGFTIATKDGSDVPVDILAAINAGSYGIYATANILAGHGLTGTATAGAVTRLTTAAKSFCIPANTIADKDCTAAELCNWASTAAADSCRLKIQVLGTYTDTTGWTKLGQVRKAGEAIAAGGGDKYCFASSGTSYFSEQCVSAAATKESCNPNASSSADVCIATATTLQHGEVAATTKIVSIGDLAYKKTLVITSGSEEVANWGAATSAKAGIKKKELLNESKPLEATRTDGALISSTGTDNKYCFTKLTGTKSDAQQCKSPDSTATVDPTEVCNPNGERGGSAEKAVCVPKKKVLAYGVEVTKKQFDDGDNICIGISATSACKEKEACVYATGACVDVGGASATLLGPWEVAEDGKLTCFGASDTEDCELTYICNPNGTTKDGKVKKVSEAVETSICWHPDAIATAGGYICPSFGEEEADKVLSNSVSASLCTEKKPNCGADGKCTDDANAATWKGGAAAVAEVTVAPEAGEAEGDATSHSSTLAPLWMVAAILATL